jgi:hypothetical protein
MSSNSDSCLRAARSRRSDVKKISRLRHLATLRITGIAHMRSAQPSARRAGLAIVPFEAVELISQFSSAAPRSRAVERRADGGELAQGVGWLSAENPSPRRLFNRNALWKKNISRANCEGCRSAKVPVGRLLDACSTARGSSRCRRRSRMRKLAVRGLIATCVTASGAWSHRSDARTVMKNSCAD